MAGKQIDIGESLRTHVETQIEAAVAKYFDRPAQAQVTFSREGPGFRCDCLIHLDTGMRLQSSGDAIDIYASFDAAADRMEKRLRRYKRRLKEHQNTDRKAVEPDFTAPYYVIASGDEAEEETADLQPVIIAETTTDVRKLSVGEAVMQLDLADRPAMVFRNSSHGGLNVVYRRPDGNIGWIDLKQ